MSTEPNTMRAWTKPLSVLAVCAALMGTAGLATAGPYDGSRPFLCAVTTVMECDAAGTCERQSPDGVNAPRFVRVDVAARTVSAAERKSQLKNVARVDGELILQGSENGRGWSATIDEETGRMAAAVVENDYTFSLFGACTIP
jgi:hypothetical protein